jgi:hypothetical protein
MKLAQLTTAAIALQLATYPAHSCAAEARNLAYEMSFVWQLADLLGEDLLVKVKALDPAMTPEFASEAESQFSIIFYNLLTECGGPLPALATQLKSVVYQPNERGFAPTFHARIYVARPEVSKTIAGWRERNLSRVMTMFSSAKYSFHSQCVEPAYIVQNPSITVAK